MSSASQTPAGIESRQKRFLRGAFQLGLFVTERATEFWSGCDSSSFVLSGERKTIGSGLACRTIRFTGSALLVCLTDTRGQNWFSWIHA